MKIKRFIAKNVIDECMNDFNELYLNVCEKEADSATCFLFDIVCYSPGV